MPGQRARASLPDRFPLRLSVSRGVPEVVISNETGMLVPNGRTDLLADAVVTLAEDESLRTRLGQAGRAKCLTMFDWRKMVDELERLYELESGKS